MTEPPRLVASWTCPHCGVVITADYPTDVTLIERTTAHLRLMHPVEAEARGL